MPALLSHCFSGFLLCMVIYVVYPQSLSLTGKAAPYTTETHTPVSLAIVFLHVHRLCIDGIIISPEPELGSVGKPETNIHFWMA